MNVISRGIRNALRNVVRTISIVVILGLSIGLSLSMLVAHQAVGQKIKSVQSSVGNTVNIAPAGLRGFEGGGEALTTTQLAAIAKIPHVTKVSEALQDRLSADNSNLQSAIDAGTLGNRFGRGFHTQTITPDGKLSDSITPPITIVGTTTPTQPSAMQGGGSLTIKGGTPFASDSNENVALVGSNLAAKNNLKVGSSFTAYGTTMTVVGIFDAGSTFGNDQVIVPLATLQRLSNQPNVVTSATATIDSVTNIDSTTTAIKNKLGTTADVTNSAEQAKQTIEPLQNIQTISLYSLVGAVAAGATIILLTMVMIVRERRREIGVLKAIGASNGTIVGQFMTEATTFTVLSAVLGIGLGVLAANPITKLLVHSSTGSPTPGMGHMSGAAVHIMSAGPLGRVHDSFANIHAVVGWSIVGYGFAAAITIAIVGSALASFFIAKIRPAEVMRTE